MDRETKQESSIPVQARVGLVSLAELVNYWESQGYAIKSMSQLVAWSVDLLCETIKRNEAMPVAIETVAEAHRHLEQRGLYQGSLKPRAIKKIGAAMRFDTMRQEGVDPRSYAPIDYNVLHNKHSVEPSPLADNYLSDTDLKAIAQKKIDEVRHKFQLERFELNKQKKDAIEIAKRENRLAEEPVKSNDSVSVKEGMSEEEFYEAAKERDRVQREKENAPLDLEFLKKNIVKKE